MAGLPWLKVYSDLPRDPRSLVLGDILGDIRAWTYVVQFRMYLADKAPVGRLSGTFAPAAFERCAGWAGEKGALLQAMRDAGFVRVGPARDGEGTEIEDLDWAREQGAHVAKVERDAKKPRGNSHTVVSPSRDIGGTVEGPSPTPRGESRELRVESREERSPASQEPAVPPREALALQPPAPKSKRQKPDKPPADPRHAPLSLALVAAGWPHHGGRTAKALAALLAHADREPGVTDAQAEVMRRAGIARAWEGFPSVREIHELAERWGHFARPQATRGTGPPDVRRGSVRAELIDHTKPEELF